jgi:hypothetical protein
MTEDWRLNKMGSGSAFYLLPVYNMETQSPPGESHETVPQTCRAGS